MNKIILQETDLDGYLHEADKAKIDEVNMLYKEYLEHCSRLDRATNHEEIVTERSHLVIKAREIGRFLKGVCSNEPNIHVYSFETPQEQHGAASRLISKLRNPITGHEEFLYYVQRAYELLFSHVWADAVLPTKRSVITRTPVTVPVQNYAVHRIPDVDRVINNSVMCVMLRGALLPSMIVSKEIQEYSSNGYVTPFALFKIKRDDSKKESNMDYILDLDKSISISNSWTARISSSPIR